MNKTILIGGGVVVVAIIVFVVVKNRSTPDDEEQASGVQMMPDSGYFAALAPSSGGMSSGDYGSYGGGGQMPAMSEEGNSGSSDYAGGFDIASLFAAMFKGQQENDKLTITSSADVNKYAITTGGYNYDSAVLAGIVGTDGTATVKHEGGNTIVTNTPGADPYQQIINNIYKQNLGRDPDLAGSVYWKNALMNNSVSITGINQFIQNSDEYKKLTAPPPVVYQPNTPTTHTQTTETDPTTGQVAVVETKRQA